MAYLDKETLEKIKGCKFFVYLRKSSEDSEDRQIASIPRQTHEVEEQLIKKYSLKIVRASGDKHYFEESQSAFKEGRPDFNEMLQRIRSGEADGVIVWHVNRLARNYGDGGKFTQMVMDGKIKIVISCSGNYENTPRDLEYLMTEFTRATRDSGDKSEAVKSGNRERFFEKKLWNGVAKPGYLNTEDPATKERIIVEDKERLPLIEKAVKLVLTGTHTPMEALHVLNKKLGYRSRKTRRQGGKPMHKSGWYRYLSDSYLYGLMKRKEGEVMGNFKPLLSKQDFDRLQIRLGKRGRRMAKHDIPYRDILKCGGCGGTVCGDDKWQVYCPECKNKFHKGADTIACKYCHTPIEEMRNPTILHYVYLFCTKNKNPKCTQRLIAVKDLENIIDNELEKFTIPDSFRDWAIKHLNNSNTQEVGNREIVRTSLKTAYDDCVKKLDSLLGLKISPQNVDGSVISDEEYNAKRKTILEDKANLLEQINGVDKRQNDWLDLSERTFNFAVYSRYWLEHGDARQKSTILDALGSNIRVMDKKLLITRHKQYFLIEKGVEEIKDLAKQFEPNKIPVLSEHLLSYEPIRTSWLRDLDSN